MCIKKIFLIYALAGLSLFFFTEVASAQVTSPQQPEWNYSGNSMPSGSSSPLSQNSSSGSREIMNELLRLSTEQSSDIRTLRRIIDDTRNLLRTYSTVSSIEINELRRLLENSGEIIKNSETRLEIALDRMNDAEDGALNLLDENIQLYAENNALKIDVQKRNVTISKQRTAIIILSVVIFLIFLILAIWIIFMIKKIKLPPR